MNSYLVLGVGGVHQVQAGADILAVVVLGDELERRRVARGRDTVSARVVSAIERTVLEKVDEPVVIRDGNITRSPLRKWPRPGRASRPTCCRCSSWSSRRSSGASASWRRAQSTAATSCSHQTWCTTWAVSKDQRKKPAFLTVDTWSLGCDSAVSVPTCCAEATATKERARRAARGNILTKSAGYGGVAVCALS
jgi:hypothetical protein